MPSRFNIRVYGIWIHDGQLLVNDEIIHGKRIIKLPGGGLELGEGPIDGLKREWMEELGLEIEILRHYYTTDFFQQSAFDDTQVISIYYLVKADAAVTLRNTEPNEHTHWVPLTRLTSGLFSLPIDRVVGGLLASEL